VTNQRSKSRDKLWHRLRGFLLHNFAPLWRFVQGVPFLARIVNRGIINTAVNASRTRPHPFSTLCDYTSWSSLTDRSYFARHLPADDTAPVPPPIEDVLRLFRRSANTARPCPKSTLLFPIFAQYLTDGFLRTSDQDRKRTTSNHEIDLSTLYGRTPAQTAVLRLNSATKGERGRLKSQQIGPDAYPPFLYEQDGQTIRAEFCDPQGQCILDKPLRFDDVLKETPGVGFARQIFAVGGDRVNATPMVAMFNTLLLREHNRLAGALEQRNPTWDDERVFQTARNILIVIYIKLVIEEYINHISSTCFRLSATPAVVWKAPWNRANWMAIEFALLYRWHALIPDVISWNKQDVPAWKMLLDNTYLTSVGLAEGFRFACAQNATQIGFYNTAEFLLPVEQRAVQQGRDLRLPRYNAYRQAMGMLPLTDFDQMTGDPRRQADLKAVYGTPDNVEFYPALFAEDRNPNTPMPNLMGAMVALDAFSQALTNPLLSEHVFNAATFTDWGLAEIEGTRSVFDLLVRNLPADTPTLDRRNYGMTRADWKREYAPF
jgi:prostaglandin-endoperoxide synthase 2